MSAAQTMDFAYGEVQAAVHEAAEAIFAPRSAARQGVARAESAPEWFDEDAWAELGESGLLGVLVPTEYGGAGHSILEACVLLQSQGRHLVCAPVLESVVASAAVLSTMGTDEQKDELLPGVAAGRLIIVPAMTESLNFGIDAPGCTAMRADGGWVLNGVKTCVPLADRAARLLVPALLDGETPTVFLLDPAADGVTLDPQRSTTGRPEFQVTLRGVRRTSADVVGGLRGAGACVRMLEQHHDLGVAALQLGILEQAMRLTARYTSERKQFGQPIATFQGVAMRAADAFIDVASLRTSLWFAAWRLANGEDASEDLDVALVWACEGGARVMWSAQHLHGGIGVDKDYPLPQYTTWAKANELAVGGSARRIARLGARLGGLS